MQHIQHVSQVIQKPSSQAGSLHTKQRKKNVSFTIIY